MLLPGEPETVGGAFGGYDRTFIQSIHLSPGVNGGTWKVYLKQCSGIMQMYVDLFDLYCLHSAHASSGIKRDL
jgi:hypothetical protein